MRADKIQQRSRSWALCFGRAVVASLALLSLLSIWLPLGRASAGNSGIKACCVGKAGHESGSCSTGLLEAAKVEPHISLAVERTAKKKPFANVKGGAGAAGNCSEHASSADTSEVEVPSSEPALVEAASEPRATSREVVSLNVHAVSNTCPNECGMCSISYTRRPRPREQSSLLSETQPPSTSLIRLIVGEQSLVRALDLKWAHSSPRAPPAVLA